MTAPSPSSTLCPAVSGTPLAAVGHRRRAAVSARRQMVVGNRLAGTTGDATPAAQVASARDHFVSTFHDGLRTRATATVHAR